MGHQAVGVVNAIGRIFILLVFLSDCAKNVLEDVDHHLVFLRLLLLLLDQKERKNRFLKQADIDPPFPIHRSPLLFTSTLVSNNKFFYFLPVNNFSLISEMQSRAVLYAMIIGSRALTDRTVLACESAVEVFREDLFLDLLYTFEPEFLCVDEFVELLGI